MKNLSNLVIIGLLAFVFGHTCGFEYGMRGDDLKGYRSAKYARISPGESNVLI
jgi:hypothetical protein